MNMIRACLSLIIIAVLGFFAHQTHTEPQTRFNSLTHRLTHPFDVRVRYRIGEVDARFGLSRAEVEKLTTEAVAIWRDGTGKEWFVYDDEAKLSINLIYDERQMETVARQKIKQDLDNIQATHQRNSENLELQRQALNEEFNRLQSELHAWQQEYNHIIHLINHSQDPAERQRLMGREQELITKQHSLNAKIEAYHVSQSTFNQAVEKINDDVVSINQSIDKANARFTPREFHKGQFDGHKIDIYEFENQDDLRLVLAHELGHALSIGHNDDPTALMYPYANEQEIHDFKLKPADIRLLNERSRWD